MNNITYSTYLDKVYGCFLGKTVIGTLGAPYEGIKMPLVLPFKLPKTYRFAPSYTPPNPNLNPVS